MPAWTRAVGLILIVMGAHAQELSPVYFNHTTIYVPLETYDALKASPLLKDEFSGSNESTIQADAGAASYTGFYVFGERTYFEFFKAGPNQVSGVRSPVGRINIAMWMDHRSQLALLRDRLGLSDIRTTRDAEGKPWYDSLRAGLDQSYNVKTWLMAEYPDGETRDKSILRTVYRADRLLHDVVAYTVTVTMAEREQLLKWFRAYGYSIREEGAKRIATGPEFVFTILPEPANGARTASVEMTLNREKTGQQIYKIGDSELKFNKDRATLTFRFPKSN